MNRTFTAYIEQDPDSGHYVGIFPGLEGGHTYGATLDELRHNLQEVLELILEEKRARDEPIEIGPFVGIQQITVNDESQVAHCQRETDGASAGTPGLCEDEAKRQSRNL